MKRFIILALVVLGIVGLVAVARREADESAETWSPVQPS